MTSTAASTQRIVLVSADNESFNLEISSSAYTATSSPTGTIVKVPVLNETALTVSASVYAIAFRDYE